MKGFEVVTNDDCKIGHVVDIEEKHLIVEHGLLKKSRHAVPETFAHADDAGQTVRLSLSKEIVVSSPRLENGSIDTQAVAEHYGLAEAPAAPDTEGYGELLDDDPRSADQGSLRAGGETDLSADEKPAGYLSGR